MERLKHNAVMIQVTRQLANNVNIVARIVRCSHSFFICTLMLKCLLHQKTIEI